MRHSAVRRLVAAIGITGALAGALGVPGAIAAQEEPSVLRVGCLGCMAGLNPFLDLGWYPGIISYDYIVGEDLQRLPSPGFAQSWTSSPDGITWTYKIWPDLKWSDGEPATAHDVAYTFNRLLDSIGTPGELNAGWLSSVMVKDDVKSVTAIDDQTVVLEALHPFVDPPRLDVLILPEHVWKDVPNEQVLESIPADQLLSLVSVVSGPYATAEYKPGQMLRMVRNPNYRGDFRGVKPTIDEVIITTFSNEDAEVAALKAGEIDLAVDVPVVQVESLANEPAITTISTPTNQAIVLTYNTRGTAGMASTDALSDPAFRDALGYLIDRQTIVDRVRLGFGRPALGALGPGMAAYYEASEAAIQPVARAFDVSEANARLDAAGYPMGADGVRLDKSGAPLNLRLYVPGDDAMYGQASQFIADWMGQAGINVTTTALEFQTLLDKLRPTADGGGDWDMVVQQSWPNALILDYLGFLTEAQLGSFNYSGWTSPEYEELFAQLRAAPDLDARSSLAAQLAKIGYEQLPVDYLWFNERPQAFRTDRVEGFVQMPEPDGQVAYNYYPELTWSEIRPAGAPAASEPASEAPSADAPAPSESVAPSPSTTPTGGTSDNTGLMIGGAAIVVLAGGAVLLLRRRRAA